MLFRLLEGEELVDGSEKKDEENTNNSETSNDNTVVPDADKTDED